METDFEKPGLYCEACDEYFRDCKFEPHKTGDTHRNNMNEMYEYRKES